MFTSAFVNASHLVTAATMTTNSVLNDNNNWGGRDIHRTTPLPIIQHHQTNSFYQQQHRNTGSGGGNGTSGFVSLHQHQQNSSFQVHQQVTKDERMILEDSSLSTNHHHQQQTSHTPVPEDEEDVELELEFLEWKLELEGPVEEQERYRQSSLHSLPYHHQLSQNVHQQMQMIQERERPSNPLARQFEQAGSRCSSTCPTPNQRQKEMPVSKRHRHESGSWDLSQESSTNEARRLFFQEGSPDLRHGNVVGPIGQMMTSSSSYQQGSPVSSAAAMMVAGGGVAMGNFQDIYQAQQHNNNNNISGPPSHSRILFASPPPSPCTVITHARNGNSNSMMPGGTGGPSSFISPPVSPSTVAPPKYYTGGPLTRVETPRTPQRSESLSTAAGSSYNTVPTSPTVPSGWRGNQLGSTPPTIFYSKPAEVPRGGGVSPLREVIRNLGIS
jgi:hypothetical protein